MITNGVPAGHKMRQMIISCNDIQNEPVAELRYSKQSYNYKKNGPITHDILKGGVTKENEGKEHKKYTISSKNKHMDDYWQQTRNLRGNKSITN